MPAPSLGTCTTTPPRTAEPGRTEAAAPGRLQLLVDADHRRHETAHRDREQQAARRQLRTRCDDLDELLGQVGEAVRRNHAEAVDPVLINAVAIRAELVRRLPCGELQQNAAAAHVAVDVLEADVLRTLGLLEALDAELDRTARGDGAAQAPELARAGKHRRAARASGQTLPQAS